MRKTFTYLFILSSYFTQAQTICGTAPEGETVILTVPPNNVITSIDFASYGTPNGSCGAFTLGTCHAANSMSIVEAVFVGQASASIGANNTVFGDPCGGTVKRLYIQATYSSTLPLTLLSYNAVRNENGSVSLSWSSDEELNTSHFVVEYSLNGKDYDAAGTVTAIGTGSHRYSFTTAVLKESATYYFRLKMTDIDGSYRYSPVSRIANCSAGIGLAVYPNPSTGIVNVSSDRKQNAIITNSSGRVIRNIRLVKGTQIMDFSALATGIYYIKAEQGVAKFIRK